MVTKNDYMLFCVPRKGFHCLYSRRRRSHNDLLWVHATGSLKSTSHISDSSISFFTTSYASSAQHVHGIRIFVVVQKFLRRRRFCPLEANYKQHLLFFPPSFATIVICGLSFQGEFCFWCCLVFLLC
ncbi:unnamed protein product [Orchesella dallaii]|uniref:Transmembrane protein n=1 Tax=Orchesella dallaii TaxID=48710 RepID=A0ABP1RKX2_9HEXA